MNRLSVWERVKKSQGEGREKGEPVDEHLRPLFSPLDITDDHLSARSLMLSTSRVKRGSIVNTRLLPSVEMLLFPME